MVGFLFLLEHVRDMYYHLHDLHEQHRFSNGALAFSGTLVVHEDAKGTHKRHRSCFDSRIPRDDLPSSGPSLISLLPLLLRLLLDRPSNDQSSTLYHQYLLP